MTELEIGTDVAQIHFECDTTPKTSWRVGAATTTERLNEPYFAVLDLETDDLNAQPALLLGGSCIATFVRSGTLSTLTGIVSEVREGGGKEKLICAQVVVEPAFEALRHRINTRIFQSKSVPEILEEVLNEALQGYGRSIKLNLSRDYPKCDYRVQYDESDFNFCERLMEEEGIVCWYTFEKVETLVLVDDQKNRGPVEAAGETTLQFATYRTATGIQEFVSDFELTSQVTPTKLATRHFDWTKPTVPVTSENLASDMGKGASAPGSTLAPERESYEHDNEPLTSEPEGLTYGSDVDARAKVHLEEQSWDSRIASGRSTVMDMAIGKSFKLNGHPAIDLNGEFFVIEVTHTFEPESRSYENTFLCIPSGVPWCPKRSTQVPRIHSVQTATVTGPSDEEIHTDEHGRIKVQFHWDRIGANDEFSSCWLRVMQPWGGTGWGFVFIPRIGMEVIVSFVNGDPDRPMVIGSVYNGDNITPMTLPDNKTKSTIKTRTSPGGDGFNELRFEDKAGEEEIYVHAQKDYNEEVLNNHSTRVGADQQNVVDGNQDEHVVKNQTLIVDQIRDKTVKKDESSTIEGHRTETVKSDETITIEGSRSLNVQSEDTVKVDGDRNITIKGTLDEKVDGDHTNSVMGARSESVNSTYDIKVKGLLSIKDDEEIKLEVGDSSITLKADGTIQIQGSSVEINGGASSTRLDDSENAVQGPSVVVKGDDGVKLDGASVDLK